MSIEIVSIGNELLSGSTVNTNAAFIAKRLSEEGWEVSRQTTLPDQKEALIAGLKEALARASVVITTGGLGPTIDDISAACAAEIFSSLPEEIPNKAGSAPGLIFDGRLIMLPGVPQEMRQMFDDGALPFLLGKIPPRKEYREALHFCLLRENDVDPLLRELEPSGVKFGIYPSYGTLTVRLASQDEKELSYAKKRLEEKFAKQQFFSPSGTIEEAVHLWFVKHKKTLALAESCTGGLMAAHLTALPGCSDYFLGSIVSYSNELKQDILGVSAQTLEKQGAVSEETVREMLKGVFARTKADWGIAVSGIAGPSGGTPGKPVGTVWYAYGERGKEPAVSRFDLGTRTRETIILIAARRLMGLLWQKIFSSAS